MSEELSSRFPSVWEKHFSLKPDDLSFHFKFYDLYSGDEKVLHEKLRFLMGKLKKPEYTGPIYLIVRELLTNSLKALYKRLYHDYFLAEIGMSDLPYQQWLDIFRKEIESHMAENFAHLCKEKNISVQCLIRAVGERLVIEVINEGVPSEVEWDRLQASMAKANDVNDLSYLFGGNEEDDDESHEGAGIGVPLISVMLKNMHLDISDFSINTENGCTVARLSFPVRIFTGDIGIDEITE